MAGPWVDVTVVNPGVEHGRCQRPSPQDHPAGNRGSSEGRSPALEDALVDPQEWPGPTDQRGLEEALLGIEPAAPDHASAAVGPDVPVVRNFPAMESPRLRRQGSPARSRAGLLGGDGDLLPAPQEEGSK